MVKGQFDRTRASAMSARAEAMMIRGAKFDVEGFSHREFLNRARGEHHKLEAALEKCISVVWPESVLKGLMKHGVDRALMHCAAAGGHKGNVEWLCKHGRDPNESDEMGVRPVHRAAAYPPGHPATLLTLYKFGADINAEDKQGNSAASLATENGHANVITALHSVGADLHKEYGGKSLMQIAAAHGRVTVMEALQAAGLDPFAPGSNGETPIAIAKLHGKVNVIKYLSELQSKGQASDLSDGPG